VSGDLVKQRGSTGGNKGRPGDKNKWKKADRGKKTSPRGGGKGEGGSGFVRPKKGRQDKGKKNSDQKQTLMIKPRLTGSQKKKGTEEKN